MSDTGGVPIRHRRQGLTLIYVGDEPGEDGDEGTSDRPTSTVWSVKARALSHLMQLPTGQRLDAIAEGLALLAEHVATLDRDIATLAETQRPRGLAILSAQADEEAAKILILLDAVRMDQSDESGVEIQLRRFYSHLARCIYVEIAAMSPADFAEVRALVEAMRPSRYLDGPNDVDWIFRNQLLAQREESLYVDYIAEEGGERWVTPATEDAFRSARHLSTIRDLIGGLHRLGCTSRAGLGVIAEHWAQQAIEERTRWLELIEINRSIVEELIGKGPVSTSATSEDVGRIIEGWPFPMGSLDLSKRQVSDSELESEREQWFP